MGKQGREAGHAGGSEGRLLLWAMGLRPDEMDRDPVEMRHKLVPPNR